MNRDRRWRLKAAGAFAAVYLIWGSTYLAIRVGVQELPPALFAGLRFLAASLLLIAYARVAGQRWPTTVSEWKTIAVAGLLLIAGANGLVVWGEQWVPSNQTALIVATTALWIAGLGTLGPQGQPLSRQALSGLVIGFLGVAVLLHPDTGTANLWGSLAILLAPVCWSIGSIYMKRRRPTTAPLMSAGLQSLVGGTLLCTIGAALGEGAHWQWSWTGGGALLYLIVFGSCIAYAAYIWLLHEVTPAALGTYAYINPAIAIVLGWWLLDETLGPTQLAGMAVILIGVVLVSTARPKEIALSATPR